VDGKGAGNPHEVASPGEASEAASRPPGESATERLSRRAIFLALLLVVALSFLTPYIEFVIHGTQIGSFAPTGNAILTLFILILLVNPLLRHFPRCQTLSRQELIGIYAVLLALAVLPSCQFAQWVIPVVTGPYYYGNPTNNWTTLTHLIPSWWVPEDRQAIHSFYEGLRSGESIPWQAWWKPLLAWGPFVLVLYLTFLCVTAILRKAWIDRERLPFPLVQLPLDMAGDDSRAFWRNKVMWAGALIPILIHSVNGLSHLVPAVPSIPLRDIQLGIYFLDRPWSAVQPFWIAIYFCLIGFAFLSARDVPFSMWFFYLTFKAECVLGSAFNWTLGGEDRSLRGNSFPLIEAQEAGAVLTMVAISLWTARAHLRDVLGKAFGRRPDVHDATEPLSYRMAVFGAIGGMLLLALWCTAAGMSFGLSLTVMLISFLFLIGIHRMMAEGGVNFLWAAQSGTNYLIFSLDGGSIISPKSWLVLLCLPYFIWDFKGPVGAQTLEGFKLMEGVRLRARATIPLIAAGMVLAIFLSYWSVIYLVYTHGGGVALDGYRFVHVGQRPFMELQSVLSYPEGTSLPKVFGMVAAGLFTWFLTFMRWRFIWWRFHPVGYAVSTIWAMNYMWFSMFLGSAANWLITRYGGLRLYRKARPFFLGFILGDFLMLGTWLVIDALLGARGYIIFGN